MNILRKSLGHTVFFLLMCLGSCSNQIQSESDYLRWLNDPTNGIVKTKHIGGFDIKIKFLPPTYLLYRDNSNGELNYSQKREDSLLEIYNHSLSFMMTIGPNKSDSNNTSVMYYGVKTYKDYLRRDLILNFDYKKYICLEANGKKYTPVLSAMENSYEIGLSRNIIFVFVPTNKSDDTLFAADNLDFIYEDELFDLGISHFVFKQKDLKDTPIFPGLTFNK